ncbi:MAG TPA: HD domain-containing phosphohydrolase [Bacillota bacterium]|nr:HD domain-containing phosphohydrolase [Bacillota bacterium]
MRGTYLAEIGRLAGVGEARLAGRWAKPAQPDAQSLCHGLLEPVLSLIDGQECHFPGHAIRVAALADNLARRRGLGPRRRFHLRLASLIHDLGKAAVPASVLAKPAPLTADERQLVQQHPVLSAAIAGLITDSRDVVEAVLHHHEWWDGTGYPHGLRGEEIPLLARILCLVDSYDAMTCDRPYRGSLTTEETQAELARGAGTQFEPRLVRLFLAVMAGAGSEPAPKVDVHPRPLLIRH